MVRPASRSRSRAAGRGAGARRGVSGRTREASPRGFPLRTPRWARMLCSRGSIAAAGASAGASTASALSSVNTCDSVCGSEGTDSTWASGTSMTSCASPSDETDRIAINAAETRQRVDIRSPLLTVTATALPFRLVQISGYLGATVCRRPPAVSAAIARQAGTS
jgi:hypothetical protein